LELAATLRRGYGVSKGLQQRTPGLHAIFAATGKRIA